MTAKLFKSKEPKYSCCEPYPAGHGGIAQRLAHQVSQQCVGSQEAEPDVCGLGELPQYRGVGEVQRPRTTVHQGHHNLGGGRTVPLSAWESPGTMGGMTTIVSTNKK